MSSLYDSNFYEGQKSSSLASAKTIVPLLIQRFHPSSVLDVGCGVGTWLRQFMDAGISDCLGLDGEWVNASDVLIPSINFKSVDLAAPPKLIRRFSMALSLEVAEHLPSSSSGTFISFLVQSAPVVVFSAAVPGQGGTGHCNEQWQSYWCALFEEHGYHPYDFVRKEIWSNSQVCWWYAQNLIVYVDNVYAQMHGLNISSGGPTNVIHPRFLEEALLPENIPFATAVKAIPSGLKRKARQLLRGKIKADS